MAEVATTEPAATTEPTTAEIVADAMADLHADEPVVDSGSTIDAGSTTEGQTAPNAEQRTVPSAPTEDDPLLVAFDVAGIPRPSDARGWQARYPLSKVKKAIDVLQKKLKDASDATIKGHTDKIGGLESEMSGLRPVAQMMRENPVQFLSELAKLPAYRPIFEQLLGETGANGSNTSTRAAVVDPNATMPQPDIALSDGRKTYSLEGIQKLLEWNAAQVEARVAKRYAPLEQSYQAHARIQEAAPRIMKQVTDARANWPLFTMHETDILAALKADQTLTLEAAYQRVVVPKLQANRDSLRAELLAEINKQPRSSSVTAPSTKPATTTEPETTADIVRQAAKAAGLTL